MKDELVGATPGPWKIVKRLSCSDGARGWSIMQEELGSRIAEVWPMNNARGDHSPEAAANADLIAAAPSLLAERDALLEERDALLAKLAALNKE